MGRITFPVSLVVVSVPSTAVVGAVVALYFKKRNYQEENDLVKKP